MLNRTASVGTLLTVALLLATAPARAQASRTWISALGDDAASCGRTNPCRSYSGAYLKTASGGEISVMDSGSFGSLTITKAITISGDGNLAATTSGLTTGIIVNAGPNDRVVLRNLSINGVGTGTDGIRFQGGKSLTLDNVSLSGFTDRAVEMTVSANAKLIIRNSRLTDAPTGIFLSATSGTAQATQEGVHLTGLTNGIEISTNGRAMISDSVISANAGNGILAATSTSRVNVEGCQIAFNDVAGVNAFGNGSFTRLSNNEIYNNANGISISAGANVDSADNNRVFDNGPSSPPNGTITIQ